MGCGLRAAHGLSDADRPRTAAFALLRGVSESDAYANLLLPRLLAERGIEGRDAALATELGYGTLRSMGTLDEILGRCVDRPLEVVDPQVLDLLRLGAYQLLRTRVPPHAAVATTVELARSSGNGRASGFVNAVLRRVSAADWDTWTTRLADGASASRALALRTAHPEWIVSAFADALSADGAADELDAALQADDERPQTHLIAFPGRIGRDELVEQSGGTAAPWSPYGVRMSGGAPGSMAAIRSGAAAVQDEGSQLCAIALAGAPLDGPDTEWLDMCAGPGGKAALLAALAAERGARLVANELHPHRAELVRAITGHWDVPVTVGDARELTGSYDRVLLDAPCSGLGALRRRPEARWRRGPDDVDELVGLQHDLLDAALRLVRPGGLVGYITCSPHVAETAQIVADRNLVDARPAFAGVPDLGGGPTVQLWPHRQGTDAMFFALLRRPD